MRRHAPQPPEAAPAPLVDTWGRHRGRAARWLRLLAVLSVLAAGAAFYRVWLVTGAAAPAAASPRPSEAAPMAAANGGPVAPGGVTRPSPPGPQSCQASAP